MDDTYIKRVYQYPDKVKLHVKQATDSYKSLHPKADKFSFSDGLVKDLLSVSGTIPVVYRQSTYNIPIIIWLLDTYPANPPICYVRPAPNMKISVSMTVDHCGKIYLPYLHEWNPNSSDLHTLVQFLMLSFSDKMPVFQVASGAAAANSSSIPYPVNPSPYNMPPSPMPTPYSVYGQQSMSPYPTQVPGSLPGYPVPGHAQPQPWEVGMSSAALPYPSQREPFVIPGPFPKEMGPQREPFKIPGPFPKEMGPQREPFKLPGPPHPSDDMRQQRETFKIPGPPYPDDMGPQREPFKIPGPHGYNPSIANPPYPAYSQHNTGTITEEHIRASLLSAVEDKVRQSMKENVAQWVAEFETLQKIQSELTQGKDRINHLMTALEREQSEWEKILTTLRDKDLELDAALLNISNQGELDVDEAVVTTAPLYKQLLTAFAEEAATEDAIYYLGEALRRGVIDLDIFLKHVRSLSRKQFMLRALMNKCRNKAGLC